MGRFFNLDRLSEKYEAISPYGYVANNPVRFIDINGEWIYIDDGEKKYRYENGQTQHQVDGEWVAIDETVELSDYAVGMVAQLNTLESSGETGAGLIDHFSNDKNNVTFMNDGGENRYNRDTGTIYYDLSRTEKSFTTDGYIDQPQYVGIGHELGHAKDPNESRMFQVWYGSTGKREIYASHIENMIRAESGLPLRTHYGTVQSDKGFEPQRAGRLIDSKGNSIYFRSGGNQRDLNEGMNIMMRVNGGEIINSRMKVGGKTVGYPYNYNSQNPKTTQ